MRIALAVIFIALSTNVHAGVSEWIPFSSDGGHISIPITVNGVATRAILDSGAAGNGITESFIAENDIKHKLGRKITVKGVAGERKVRLIDGLELGMFGAEFKLDRVIPVNLRNADVVIGLSFFNNFVLQIDYPKSQMRIITHDALNLKELANVRMKKGAGSPQPIVKVDMNGESDLWLTLDTGNNTGILLPRKSAMRFDWLQKYGSKEAQISGVNTTADVDVFNLPEFTIGPIVLENVKVIVPSEGERMNVGEEVRAKTGTRIKKTASDGILGFDVLKHFVVTIDYKHSFLHLGVPAE